MKLSYDKIREVCVAKGYTFFDHGDFNVNVFGVRSPERRANQFDDTLGVAWREGGEPHIFTGPGTTDPGLPWLLAPMNARGTAILVPGQYRGVYGLRMHRGAYMALCQTYGPVRVYRDDNRDAILDIDLSSIQTTTEAGINIHHASNLPITNEVNRYSAGCQVWQRIADFNRMMELAYEARKRYGNHFTYTLFEEADFS